ncbi:MAG: sigma-54-dependent Fis family transcriptional regulator [Bryobacteraceae bacterium]|nr:sigma-54-dependent Fis family transcriptional regulator [Bryobacteraceae bacterium]
MPDSPASPATRVLIVDDEENQRRGLASMISAWGFAAETACDGQEAIDKLQSFDAHVVITDLMMPRVDGFELLRRLGQRGSRATSIVLTAFGSIETAISTIHELGAFWFLEKPIKADVMRVLLERAANQSRLAEQAERLRRQLSYQGVLGDLVGSSTRMQEVYSLIRQVAPSRASVFITGESGTGKELVARAVHQLSNRSAGPFVAINCAALPETLMESELFGHEKGAFTGALERRAGCFELAQRGTLFLDEICEMPVATQAKLLRVLEDSRVRRLGGKSEIQVDVRVLAATNRELLQAMEDLKLREDLYYRLNVVHLKLPPLRDRLEDLPQLIEALLADLNEKNGGRVTGVERDVLERFLRYAWPGNVRELRNVLERAVVLAGEGAIPASLLPPGFGQCESLQKILAGSENGAVTVPVGTKVGDAERALILSTLEHTNNNKTRAAEILGISLKTLFNKLKEYGSPGKDA